MSSPAREAILDNLVTALATIATTGGYNHSVTGVDRVFRDPHQIKPKEAPRMIVAPDPEPHRFVFQPSSFIRVTQPFAVIGVAFVSAAANRSDTAAKLEDDMIAALLVDPTRGGNAVVTTIREAQWDDALDRTGDQDGNRVVVSMTIECVFFRTHGLTS